MSCWIASSRLGIATSLLLDATLRESPRSYARLNGGFAGIPVNAGPGARSIQERRALGELEVEGRRRERGVGLEVGHLGDSGDLVANRFDEAGHDPVLA